jgi:DNA polymerase I-like protein with 3'-5' exonuclease and polymerase domains
MRCTIDPNTAYTLRVSTYENAFGTGMNMQNIPSDKSKAIGKAAKRVRVEGMEMKLPNLRDLFLPDEGKIIWDADLDRADLQIVVWEANDQMLKKALHDGVDIHLLNAFVLAGAEPPDLLELIENGPRHDRYLHWRSRYKLLREFAKVFCHGTNYGGSAKTMASNCGVLVHEADRAQKIWFGAHPGIKTWHRRVEQSLMTTRSVSNKFGYTAIFFDRIEALLPEALAWIPQSTVAEVIDRGWINLLAAERQVEVLMQVHDSLVGQFDPSLKDYMVPKIKEHLSITIPYDDPLVIPVGVKTSDQSWGSVR